MTEEKHGEDIDRSEEWEQLRATYLRSPSVRPESSAQGVHHLALLSSDVEQTIAFYQGVLEFPLTELFENRDYTGSTHFFSISATEMLLRSLTFRVWNWVLIEKCWGRYIIWRFQSPRTSGTTSEAN